MKSNSVGKIIDLYISKQGFNGRINQSELVLDEDGIFADKFYGKNINRSVLITSTKAYQLAKENSIKISHGDLGENILVDFDLDILQDKTKIKIGDVILEIVQKCTLCNSLSKIDKALPSILETDRGIFAKVLQRGLIKKNDTVEKIITNG